MLCFVLVFVRLIDRPRSVGGGGEGGGGKVYSVGDMYSISYICMAVVV